MKKLYVILFVTMLSCTVYSQTTWNLRGGFGQVSYRNEDSNGGKFDDECPTYFGMLQCNIPVVSRFSVSPTLIGGGYGDLEGAVYSFSALVGYRAKISNKTLFFPKVGPAITGEGFGVAVDLPFEMKHFIIGSTGYFADKYMIALTVGYKF